MASNHALSYAFWTSRKITYAVFPFFLVSWIVCFSVMRWSQVALPGVPPACDPVITTCFFILSLTILSYTLPALLARVIPLSFEHFPFFPLPLYSLRISPSRQLSALWILLKILHSMCLVSWSASMNTSFGILSGPRLFFLFSLLMALFISFGVMGSSPCSGFVLLFLTACSTATLISSVDLWYSGCPSLAWYRFWKYSATYSRVSSGSVKVMLSSVIVLYSMLLVACAFFLACHIMFGSILAFSVSFLILFSVCFSICCSMSDLTISWVPMYAILVFSFSCCVPLRQAPWNSFFAIFLAFFAVLISSDLGMGGLSTLFFCLPTVSSIVLIIVLSVSS